MKIIKVILKIIMLILTAIWGIGCGILFPVFILATGDKIVAADIANDPLIIIWLITAIIGYILPAVLVMCRLFKTASALSLLGFGGLLVVYSRFSHLYQYTEGSSGPSELYMPLIFVTIIILIITVLENIPVIRARLEKRAEDRNAQAPSIFSENTNKK